MAKLKNNMQQARTWFLIGKHAKPSLYRLTLDRTVYPCGFGAFCSELFVTEDNSAKLDVVYDCGAKYADQKTHIKNFIIDDYTANKRTIDVLFVSHFHDDHINCIQHLPLRKDTLIVLPYIYDDYQLFFEFFHEMGYTDFLLWLQEKGFDKVLLVDPYDPTIDINKDGESLVDGEDPNKYNGYPQGRIDSQYSHIKPFDSFNFPIFDWIYTPFHLQDKSLYRSFLQYALANGFKESDFRDFDGKDRNLNKRIKDLYQSYCDKDKAAKHSLNASSMILVSRPNNVVSWKVESLQYSLCNKTLVPPQYYWMKRLQASCLYTGDTPLSTSKYEKEFLRVSSTIMPKGAGLVQLPHHGSIEGYNSILYDIKNCHAVFVNCYELAQNRKGEPVLYTKAILDAARKRMAFFAVSEELGTRLEIRFVML